MPLSAEELDKLQWKHISEAAELERCRARLHELRGHPDYEYTSTTYNNLEDGWQRNVHIGPNGFSGYSWHWMRRKGDVD